MTKICITGGAGFIAHAIETILNETDWDIVTMIELIIVVIIIAW